MAHIRRHPKTGKWQVRYIDPKRNERSRTFVRKLDAEAFLHEIESKNNRGEFIDPDLSRITLGQWTERWIGTRRDLKPSTTARDESYLRNYVLPTFGPVPLINVEPDMIESWIASLEERGLAPATIHKAYGLLNRLLSAAVRTRRMAWNPASAVQHLPRQTHQ